MRKAIVLLSVIGSAIVTMSTFYRHRRAEQPIDSPRTEQNADGGTPIVDEWGDESFPASDPPQSW